MGCSSCGKKPTTTKTQTQKPATAKPKLKSELTPKTITFKKV